MVHSVLVGRRRGNLKVDQSGNIMEGATKIESVQVFGRKKNATAVAICKRGRGLIKVNSQPIELLEPEILRVKTFEPVLLLGQQRFANVRMLKNLKCFMLTFRRWIFESALKVEDALLKYMVRRK